MKKYVYHPYETEFKKIRKQWKEALKALVEVGLTEDNFQDFEKKSKDLQNLVRQIPRDGKCFEACWKDTTNVIGFALKVKASEEKNIEEIKYLKSIVGCYGTEVDKIIQTVLSNKNKI